MDKPTRMFARDATTHPQTAATGPPYTYAVGKPPALQRNSAGHHVRVSPSLCVSPGQGMRSGMHAEQHSMSGTHPDACSHR